MTYNVFGGTLNLAQLSSTHFASAVVADAVSTLYWQVKELATVSLTNPVKVFVNENKDIAFNLQQEFIRIRPHMEADREAIVAGQLTALF